MFIIKATEQRLDEMAGNTMFVTPDNNLTEWGDQAETFDTEKDATAYIDRLSGFSSCWRFSAVEQNDYTDDFDTEAIYND